MMSDRANILEGQLRQCYGRVVYSHKTHEKRADILFERQNCIKLMQIMISALVTGGITSTLCFSEKWIAMLSAVLSTVLFALNIYAKNYNLGELAQKHRQTGADLWIIREKYLSLLTDIRTGDISLESIRVRRDTLLDELHAIYDVAPSTDGKAYSRAKKALKKQGDMRFSDEEIDDSLPEELKRVPKRSGSS